MWRLEWPLQLGARAANVPSPRGDRESPFGYDYVRYISNTAKFLVKHYFVRHRSNTHFSPHEELGCRRHWETRSGSIAWKRAIPWTNWRSEPIPARATFGSSKTEIHATRRA